jgi:hypothetical protein
MNRAIGFVLLTHEKPRQVVRLVNRLNEMFDEPPIVCHHDFSKCDFSGFALPRNLSFVRPYLETRWAEFSVVEGAIRAMRQLYGDGQGPDWFVMLSGADYPIRPAEAILRDLDTGSFDAHIEMVPIAREGWATVWEEVCYKRYKTLAIRIPHALRRLGLAREIVRLKHPAVTRLLIPVWNELRCFAGSQWFSGNARPAAAILDFHDARPQLARHYSRLMFPEESYFQTILANTPDMSLNDNNWRYADWSAEQAHPKTLTREDLPRLHESGAHFARKFDPDVDASVLDRLDEAAS